MLSKDLHIKISGINDNESTKLVSSITNIINTYNNLDFRRLEKIIVTSTFERDVESLTTVKDSIFKNRYRSTKDTFAVVLTIPKKDDFELVLVMKSSFALNLIENNSNVEMSYKDALHIFHHELGHVHDNNLKIDAFKDFMLNSSYKGKSKIFYPLAEIFWSEYIANYISSSSAIDSKFPKLVAENLALTIKECDFNIKTERLAYKTNENREDLIDSMQNHISSLFKTAAYVLGYMHGMNVSLAQLSDETDFVLETSYFKDIWEVMIYELNTLIEIYPHGWEKIDVYDSLAYAFEAFYNQMGIVVFEDDNKNISFKIV